MVLAAAAALQPAGHRLLLLAQTAPALPSVDELGRLGATGILFSIVVWLVWQLGTGTLVRAQMAKLIEDSLRREDQLKDMVREQHQLIEDLRGGKSLDRRRH